MGPSRCRASLAVLLALSAILAGMAAQPGRAGASQGSDERITDYQVDIRIEQRGAILVSETIAYDFGPLDRHGIFRDIPVRLRYDDVRDGYDRVYPVELLSVSGSPGTPDQFVIESAGDTLRLRIGDPERTISGRHTYEVVYRVEQVLNGFEGHVELFWNAVGAGWQVPVERSEVRVEAPAGISAIRCFAGPERSTQPCAMSAVDGDQARFSHGRLEPFESFTVVAALPTGVVPPPEPVLEQRWSLARAFSLTPVTGAASLALTALVVGAFSWLAWRTGRDRRWVGSEVDIAFGNTTGDDRAVALFERHRPPVEFAPPDGIRPGQIGTLMDEVAHPLDVTATIIDLAVRGYLRIDELPADGWFARPDWALVRRKNGEGLVAYEALLLGALFEDGDEVRLSDLKERFARRLARVQDALYNDVASEGWFATRPDRLRQRWRFIGVGALLAGVALVVAAAAWSELALLALPAVAGGLLLVVGARWMPRRTAKGTGTLRRVLGFRRLIDESETERARFAEQQHLFSEYLPYAVVFGRTEKWARAFAGLEGALPDTGWYRSPHPFTAVAFSRSVEGFSVTTAGTLTSTPAGSGTSGFSGGGFSGGGAGGGGGGSW